MARAWKTWVSRTGFVAAAGLALSSAGCIAAAVGAAAAGGAAVGYAYWNAPLVRDYAANFGDAQTATKTALADLQFPVLKEQPDGAGTLLETRTGDNVPVRIFLDLVTSPVPADGSLTRISVRVGHFGDDAISTRIQDQIARHLPTAAPLARPAAPPPVAESAPPPLAAPVAQAKHEVKQP